MADHKKAEVSHIEGVATLDEKMTGKNMIDLAQEASQFEHHLSPLEAIKAYPMAVFWSLAVSMCVVMEGQ